MTNFNVPHGEPIKVHWVLPSNFTEKDADQFLEPAIKMVGRPDWSTITREDGSEIVCVDVAEISFPGFFQGDRYGDGRPALNEYVVTLTRSEATLVGALLRLLSMYGADVKWENSLLPVSV